MAKHKLTERLVDAPRDWQPEREATTMTSNNGVEESGGSRAQQSVLEIRDAHRLHEMAIEARQA
jgi:hypothetical protein